MYAVEWGGYNGQPEVDREYAIVCHTSGGYVAVFQWVCNLKVPTTDRFRQMFDLTSDVS